MKCVMHQVHGSSLSPQSSSQLNKHHELSTCYQLQKNNSLTLPHLLESLPLCCHQTVGILLNSAKPIQAKPWQKSTKQPRPSTKCHTVPIPLLLCAQLASFRWRASFNSAANACQSDNLRSDLIIYTSPMIKIKFSNTSLSMGALGPNSHQMLLYSTPKCCKPFKKIDVRFLRISMTRLMGKGRSESMRPLTASFESLWLTSQLLQVTWASLTIRMMTTSTLQVLQWHEMRHAPSSRLFSQPTELLSTKQTSWTKHLLPASKKQLVDTSPPLGKPSALLPSNGRHPDAVSNTLSH